MKYQAGDIVLLNDETVVAIVFVNAMKKMYLAVDTDQEDVTLEIKDSDVSMKL